MADFQDRLKAEQERILEHWIKNLPVHTEYIEDAANKYFQRNPDHIEAMRPRFLGVWKKFKRQG